jgi:hypothetical protein
VGEETCDRPSSTFTTAFTVRALFRLVAKTCLASHSFPLGPEAAELSEQQRQTTPAGTCIEERRATMGPASKY